MVNIVDPHIKQDNGYHLYKEAKDQDYFIRNKDNNEFQGWCWPGTSHHLNFLFLLVTNPHLHSLSKTCLAVVTLRQWCVYLNGTVVTT